jgi:hypothetical protein
MKFLSPRTHSIIGFIVGIALLLAPNLFGFSDVGGPAALIPRLIGVIIIVSELTVKGSFSGMGMVPMRLHIGMDVFLGAVLALSPWLFGFADEEANAWVPHLLVGIMVVGAALVTRTNEEEARAN